MNINEYAEAIKQKYGTGQAREHAYRPILETLMKSFQNIDAVNEPKKSAYGNPDLVFLKKSHQTIILGYAEAKDIDKDLDKIEKTEQLARYSGYENLYLTNYLEFRFFQNGDKYRSIEIGKFINGEIVLKPENYDALRDELAHFLELPPETIKNGKRLARIMGAKGRRIRNNVAEYLVEDSSSKNDELEKIYKMMRTLLVHDLTPEKFADMYAQTLVYGLFVARYGDKTPDGFTRQEARDLVPKSNPFLQKFFDHIVGPEFVTSLSYIVDELCEVFSVSNVAEIVHKHLKIFDETAEKDPIIHFYEDFLKEYDPVERKKMGAYYTPLPVVRFIIREVDRILKEDFGITKGLADSEKKTIGTYKHSTKQTLHRVQILDPAVGTATFLNEIIKHIRKEFEGQEGRWENYIKEDLLPRLYGFELMMAPYTIAHLKLGMTLQESGVIDLDKRLGVYLTNTLEEGIPNQLDLDMAFGLSSAVAEEAQQAGVVKQERPVMIVVGNPPYSGVSSNETIYANSLISKYKVEPGGKQKLQEKKHWLNDDYVKFIGFAEEMISKNGEGIVAMITNNGYLDNPTFRGMRWHLAKTFDKIYVLDLHGNSKKKEISPDGSKDENVFDIQQGVGIILGVKSSKKTSKKLAEIYHAEIFGSRKSKFKILSSNVNWQKLRLDNTKLYFVPKDMKGKSKYDSGIALNELFNQTVAGIVTARDKIVIDNSVSTLIKRIEKFTDPKYSDSEIRQWLFPHKKNGKYKAGDSRGWKLNEARLRVHGLDHSRYVKKISYRPFDTRWIYYSPFMVDWGREKVMKNYMKGDNIGLIFERSVTGDVFVVESAPEHAYLGTAGYAGQSAPLYIYNDDGSRTPNFNRRYLNELTKYLDSEYPPEAIIDYTYAILHSPTYRKANKEFLKTEYPRIPIPKSDRQFEQLVKFGTRLRELHLIQSVILDTLVTKYPIAGDDQVESVVYKNDQVWINDKQYFGNVPELAWNFYIGGYQPAQKWLKDRKGQKLTNDDIVHYQKIIKVLVETDRVMKEIDDVWNT